MKLLVVVNANARRVRRSPALPGQLRALVGDLGQVVVTHDAQELAACLARAAAESVPLVAACGGDGTHLQTLTELVRAYGEERLPRFALLPGGTVNTVARNLGVRGSPAERLAQLVAELRADRIATVEQQLLRVNQRYGFLCAALMGARFLEAYYRAANPGPGWATLLALRTAGSSLVQGSLARSLFAPELLELTVDGERLPPAPYRLLVASVVRDVGLGMKVAWQAAASRRRFHLVASGISTTSMALQLPRVLAGRPLAGAPHVDRLAERVRVTFTAPRSYTLDGDLFQAAELDIAVGPRVAIVRP